jgi:hypothetical protein
MTGRGHPESANIAGLPAGDSEERLAEFRNGLRASSLPANLITIAFAKALTDDEVKRPQNILRRSDPKSGLKLSRFA